MKVALIFLPAPPIIGPVLAEIHARKIANKPEPALKFQTAKAEFHRQPPLNPVIIPRHAIATPGNVAHGIRVRVADHKVDNV